MSKPEKTNPSLLYVEPDSNKPFLINQKPSIGAVPVSDTLSRLKAFLPQMQKANEETARKAQIDPNSVNIEEIDEDSKQVLQMDLMLVPDDSDDSNGESDSGDDQFSEESDEPVPILVKQLAEKVKAEKEQKKVKIEVLSSNTD